MKHILVFILSIYFAISQTGFAERPADTEKLVETRMGSTSNVRYSDTIARNDLDRRLDDVERKIDDLERQIYNIDNRVDDVESDFRDVERRIGH